MTVTPLFCPESGNQLSIKEAPKRQICSNISDIIEILYPSDSEFRKIAEAISKVSSKESATLFSSDNQSYKIEPALCNKATVILKWVLSQEIVLTNLNVHWDDVIGLDECKAAVREAAVYPIKYPIFFRGKFSPWKGILLYGPPGTGETQVYTHFYTFKRESKRLNRIPEQVKRCWRRQLRRNATVLFST